MEFSTNKGFHVSLIKSRPSDKNGRTFCICTYSSAAVESDLLKDCGWKDTPVRGIKDFLGNKL